MNQKCQIFYKYHILNHYNYKFHDYLINVNLITFFLIIFFNMFLKDILDL
jgi:hypothetical protein